MRRLSSFIYSILAVRFTSLSIVVLRFHQYYNVHQDNYLIGPRLKVMHFWRAQPYVKGLIGFTNMDLGPDAYDYTKDDTGRFTTYALGAGLDIRATRHWTVRLPDFEYQKYPYFGDRTDSSGTYDRE